jgi:hypothetical protein
MKRARNMLERLYGDVMFHMLSFLDDKSLSNLSQTCKYMNSMCWNDVVWKCRYEANAGSINFEIPTIFTQHGDKWRRLYRYWKLIVCSVLSRVERLLDNKLFPLYTRNILRALIEENAHHQQGIFHDVYKIEDTITHWRDDFISRTISCYTASLFFVTMSGVRYALHFDWSACGSWTENSTMIVGCKFSNGASVAYESLSVRISDCTTVFPNAYRITMLGNRILTAHNQLKLAEHHTAKVEKYFYDNSEFVKDADYTPSKDSTRGGGADTRKRTIASWLQKAMVYDQLNLRNALVYGFLFPDFRNYSTLIERLWTDKGYGKCLLMDNYCSPKYRLIATCLSGKPIAVLISDVHCKEPESDTKKRTDAFPPMYHEETLQGAGVLLLYQVETAHPEYVHQYQVINISLADSAPLPPESEPKPYIQDDIINTKRLYYTLTAQ